MAFGSAGGYTNLPNGNFSPVIYSKQVQIAFRKSSTVEDITNNDYFGEISNMGDSVRIMKEPNVAVSAYLRGTTMTSTDLQDDDFTMVINKANAFQFQIDDIEEAHSHIKFQSLAADKAGYNLRDQYDMEVLGYLSGYKQTVIGAVADTVNDQVAGTVADAAAGTDELLASNKLAYGDFGEAVNTTFSIPLAISGAVSPLAVLNRMARVLDQKNVSREGRWVVVDPVFVELLNDENSKLLNADFAGGGEVLKNGKVATGLIRGFRIYVTNNLPVVGTGPETTASGGSAANFGVIVAGHDSSTATAQQINKVEKYRSQDTFADVCRGLHLYGRKILRPEGLVNAKWNLA